MAEHFRIQLGRRALSLCWLILVCGASLGTCIGHEIPSDVTLQIFLKPEGARLELLVRVPLEALRDFNWPTQGPGYLELSQIDPLLREAVRVWIADNLELYEDGLLLGPPAIAAERISLPNDRSFSSYPEALAHLNAGPLPADVRLYWQQALLDVLLEYPIVSPDSTFSIRPSFGRLGMRVMTALFFLPPRGVERAFQLSGNPGLVELDPRWYQAVWRFVKLGFLHILDGIDHLLFLLCLVIPLRRFRSLIVVVSSFTVAHSITLLSAAFGLAPTGLWFPPLIETLIAASIVYMAIENVLARRLDLRWIIAFGFGLVHGFGFSFALQETLQFAGRHLLASLFSFNLGVEIGQLLVIALLVPALNLFFRLVDTRMGIILLSLLVGHTAWHWMTDRGATLAKYEWPEWSAANLAVGLRWLMLLVAVAGLLWLVRLILRQFPFRASAGSRLVDGSSLHPKTGKILENESSQLLEGP